jgi:hypothetical protein
LLVSKPPAEIARSDRGANARPILISPRFTFHVALRSHCDVKPVTSV